MSAGFSRDAYRIKRWFGQRFENTETEKAYGDHVAFENAATRTTIKYVLLIVYTLLVAINFWTNSNLTLNWNQISLLIIIALGVLYRCLFWPSAGVGGWLVAKALEGPFSAVSRHSANIRI